MPDAAATYGQDRDEGRRLAEAQLPGRAEDAEAVRAFGHSLSRKGDVPAALKLLAYAVALAPASVEVRLTQLQVAANAEDRPAGAALAEEAVRALPGDPRVGHFAARALRRNRDFARAAELWRGVAEAEPADPAPLIDAAGCLIRAKDHAGALDCATQALARHPASLEAHDVRAEALKGLSRPEALGEAVEGLAALDPAKALGHLPGLMAGGRYGSIAAVLRRCRARGVPVDPRIVEPLTRILRNVAQLAEAENRNRDAALLWASLAENEPADAGALDGLRRCVGVLLREADEDLQGGRTAEAAGTFRTVLSLDPREKQAGRGLAGILTESGAWQEAAEAWLASASGSTGSERAEAALQSAMLAGKLDSPPAALTLLARLRDLDTGEPSIRGWGVAAAQRCLQALADGIESGRLPGAVESAVAVRIWQADDAKLARLSRRLVAELGTQTREAVHREDAPAAAALASLTLRVDPDHVGSLKVLAGQALKAHRFAEAAERYGRLAHLEPAQARHLERLGQAYRNLRDVDKGIDAYRRLLRLEPGHVQGRERLAELESRAAGQPGTGRPRPFEPRPSAAP